MMLNRSWLGNCLGIMDIRLLVGRSKRFLPGLGSKAVARWGVREIAVGSTGRDELSIAKEKGKKVWGPYVVSSCWILDFGFISCTVRVPACSRWFLIVRLSDVACAM